MDPIATPSCTKCCLHRATLGRAFPSCCPAPDLSIVNFDGLSPI